MTHRSDTQTIIATLRKIAIRCEHQAHTAASDGDAMDHIIHAVALREAADRMEEMHTALMPFARMEDLFSMAREDNPVNTRTQSLHGDNNYQQDVMLAGDSCGWARLTRRNFREAKRAVAGNVSC